MFYNNNPLFQEIPVGRRKNKAHAYLGQCFVSGGDNKEQQMENMFALCLSHNVQMATRLCVTLSTNNFLESTQAFSLIDLTKISCSYLRGSVWNTIFWKEMLLSPVFCFLQIILHIFSVGNMCTWNRIPILQNSNITKQHLMKSPSSPWQPGSPSQKQPALLISWESFVLIQMCVSILICFLYKW